MVTRHSAELDSKDFMAQARARVPIFVNQLRGQADSGFFHYSMSGDLLSEQQKWGLGNTVFAIKIFHTVGILAGLQSHELKRFTNFINSFRHPGGWIYDPQVRRRATAYDIFKAISERNLKSISHHETIVAETRQALSALKLLKQTVEIPDLYRSMKPADYLTLLNKLNWNFPWHAGSQLSHMLFFLANSGSNKSAKIITSIVDWINNIQKEDGSWYSGNPTLQQRINGAMKVMTGFAAANYSSLPRAEQLIDLCLSAQHDAHACDNFNVVYVVNQASKHVPGYRKQEITNFMLARLANYRQYYYPSIGGFSSLLGQANVRYYGAKITRGLNEPDIHGTVMFVWGMSEIAEALGLNKLLGFKQLIS